MGLQADLRAACVSLLTGYAASASLNLSVYAGRPRTIAPPHAFIDSINESTNSLGVTSYQRHPVARIVVLHGEFDGKDTVAQRDAFVDGFIPYAYAAVHAAGPNTVIGDFSIEDDPTYVPDWQPDQAQKQYFATVISITAFGGY